MKTSIIVALTLCCGLAAGAPSITTGSLVEEMVDMRQLTYIPDPFFKTIQFSSYDRRSSLPAGPDWFSNSDGFGREPIPNVEEVLRAPDAQGVGEYLLCDVAGPGAIVRTWSARMFGTIQMYLDGNEEPVFDGPAEEFLMRPYDAYAAQAGLDKEALQDTFYQRNAAYCPIPFAKRCRIVWKGNLRRTHFYEIQVRCYDEKAQVETFKPADLAKYEKTILRTAKTLANPDTAWDYASKKQPVPIEATVGPGETVELLALEGAGAIERLSLLAEAPNLDKALRQTILNITCDEYPWGQVQAPLGDFFGAAPGVNPYASVPFTVAPGGMMTCRYVMPYAKSIRVTVENRGNQAVQIRGEALPMDYEWEDSRSMHFRARWRVNHDLVADGERTQDMPYLIAQGTGTYVGTALMMLNPNDIPMSGGNWWGEGDEKIFVDDDVRPSTFGTGSEDYFNYAWSSNEIFLFPYCGQPRNDGPANRGFVTNQRWHILDSLPFKNRLSFYMELKTHERTENFSYARIAYHYGRPGLMDDHVAITSEDVRHLELPANWMPAARRRAVGSTFYQAEDIVETDAKLPLVQGNLWSGGRHLRWRPKGAGDQLRFTFGVEQESNYAIRVALAMDSNSGKITAQVDERDLAVSPRSRIAVVDGVADLYRPHRTMLRCLDLGAMKLTKGPHTITLTFKGGEKEVGVDFIWVQKPAGRR